MKIAIIGGGASGMACAAFLSQGGADVTLLERGERLGRKLAATGNGQGNVTNFDMGAEHYFTDDREKLSRALSRFGAQDTVAWLENYGGIFLPDSRGRVYPAGRQASAVCDLLRSALFQAGVRICTGAKVDSLSYDGNFRLEWQDGQMFSDAVVLAAGGKAAKNFGTDGNAYVLAQSFGHSVTPLSPALVQLRCDPASVRGLKGIRVDARLCAVRAGKTLFEGRGDVLFTESGISGDAAFRASSFVCAGDELYIDLLPDVEGKRLVCAIEKSAGEGLPCIVNNALGRFLEKRAALGKGDKIKTLARLIKRFPLTVTGTLGFDYAQVTKGGIPLAETDERFMSRFRRGLYFAGEILNVDGECGGYNLQWAFTSAYCVAEGLLS